MASDDKHRDKHADNMRKLGQAWATPLMIVFSLGALISLGQSSIGLFIHAVQTHTWTAQLITDIAILLIAFVGVVGMDLVLINNAIDMRDLSLRNMTIPAGLRIGTYGIATVEALTFAYVAWQLDNPPSFSVNWPLALTIWGFIIMRAIAFPAAAIRLATLGKRPVMLRQILQDHLIVVGDRLATEIQDPSRKFTIPQLLEMMVADEQGGNATSQEGVVAAAKTLISIYEQPIRPQAIPEEEEPAPDDPQAPGTGHTPPKASVALVDATEALEDRSGVYTPDSDALQRYALPDGVSLMTEASMRRLCELLGVKAGALSQALANSEMTWHGPTGDQPSGTKQLQVWQILGLYEGGLLKEMPSHVTRRDLASVR